MEGAVGKDGGSMPKVAVPKIRFGGIFLFFDLKDREMPKVWCNVVYPGGWERIGQYFYSIYRTGRMVGQSDSRMVILSLSAHG
jgi:hypothetical protein